MHLIRFFVIRFFTTFLVDIIANDETKYQYYVRRFLFRSRSLHQHINFVVFLLGNVKQILFCQPIIFHGVHTECACVFVVVMMVLLKTGLFVQPMGWWVQLNFVDAYEHELLLPSINQLSDKKTQFWQTHSHTHTSIVATERACVFQHTQHDLMNFDDN